MVEFIAAKKEGSIWVEQSYLGKADEAFEWYQKISRPQNVEFVP